MDLIGHRGAMDLEPENTLRSFKKALKFPYIKMIELDVYCLKTGELVVIHDNKVDRTTNGKGYVMEKTFKEIRMLDAGKGEKIPTLEEVLDLVDKKVEVNIELKGPNTAEATKKCIEKYVKKGWTKEHFFVSSFDHIELMKFKKLMPDVRIGVLIEALLVGYAEYAEKLGAFSINPSAEVTNKTLVDDAHKRGLKVFCWTLKDADEIKRMKDLGVDGIFVNNPEFAYKTLEGLQ